MCNHISLSYHFKTKKTKNTNECQRYMCFCVYDCAGKDFTQNGLKSHQNEHETGKSQTKSSPGSPKSKECSKHPKKSSFFDKMTKMTLGDSFMEITRSVPALLRIGNFSPSKKSWKLKSTWSFIFEDFTKIILEARLLNLQKQSLAD